MKSSITHPGPCTYEKVLAALNATNGVQLARSDPLVITRFKDDSLVFVLDGGEARDGEGIYWGKTRKASLEQFVDWLGEHQILSPPKLKKYRVIDEQADESPIENISNNCYLNVALQMLSNIPTFRWRLYRILDDYPALPKDAVSVQVRTILSQMELGKKVSKASMMSLIHKLNSKPGRNLLGDGNHVRQADSFDALQYLIGDIEREMVGQDPLSGMTYFRDLLFTRHYRIDKNSDCGTQVGFTNLSRIGFDLHQIDTKTMKKPINLSALIEGHLAQETNGGLVMQHQIEELPVYLFIHLPRFDHEGLRQNFRVEAPLELNLTNHVIERPWTNGRRYVYELVGAGIHTGGEEDNSGHWTAELRRDNGKWFEYDDDKVARKVKPPRVSSRPAYYMYRRIMIQDEQYLVRAIPESDLMAKADPLSDKKSSVTPATTKVTTATAVVTPARSVATPSVATSAKSVPQVPQSGNSTRPAAATVIRPKPQQATPAAVSQAKTVVTPSGNRKTVQQSIPGSNVAASAVSPSEKNSAPNIQPVLQSTNVVAPQKSSAPSNGVGVQRVPNSVNEMVPEGRPVQGEDESANTAQNAGISPDGARISIQLNSTEEHLRKKKSKSKKGFFSNMSTTTMALIGCVLLAGAYLVYSKKR